MTTPDIVLTPDGHYQCAIYGLGPYITDYPEQVLLAAVVFGWCAASAFVQFPLKGNKDMQSHNKVLEV
jgi:hypothetical protein